MGVVRGPCLSVLSTAIRGTFAMSRGCQIWENRGWPFCWIAGVTLAGVTPGLRRLAWLIEVRGLANRSEGFGGSGPVDKWHACPGSYNKFINFATNGTHAQPRRIGTIKDECVGRAMLGVKVNALGEL